MSINTSKINDDNPEILATASKNNMKCVPSCILLSLELTFSLSPPLCHRAIRNLGVIIGPLLSRMTATCKSLPLEPCRIRHIRPFLSVLPSVLSRLDYCNSVLSNRQRAQINVLVGEKADYDASITSVAVSLRWH